MAKKKVCVSFDYENDRGYYYLLEAWNKNSSIDFGIEDCTPSEIETESVAVVKQVLSRKIGDANYMIAIIGKHSNDKHPDSNEIGYRNWQAYEVAKNAEKGNHLVVVKLDSGNIAPNECCNVGAKWVTGFILDKIAEALSSFSKS
ncbi:MAG: TIR domain-containing protein [Oscillospiraceae bacterium]|nr:TIR domain-containing protein [Oscillospiraceae bacterium]